MAKVRCDFSAMSLFSHLMPFRFPNDLKLFVIFALWANFAHGPSHFWQVNNNKLYLTRENHQHNMCRNGKNQWLHYNKKNKNGSKIGQTKIHCVHPKKSSPRHPILGNHRLRANFLCVYVERVKTSRGMVMETIARE